MKLRISLLCLLSVSLLSPVARSQRNDGPLVPPGRMEIAKYPLQLEPPVGPQQQKLDASKLRDEAAELSKLAQSIPSDVDQVSQGKLPKDFGDKLKRIEKLSKHLRGELNQ